MLKIGLTGGIGSGKSAAADYFKQLGVPVIDADLIARDLTGPGQEALREIVEVFGPGILTPAGNLDRPAMRQRIFSDPAARERLETILHSRIRDELLRQLTAINAPYCVLVIPLLVEKGWGSMVDRILVIDVPTDEQIARTRIRDNISDAQVRAILASQTDRETRLAAADDVLHNDADLAHLHRQIGLLHGQYLALAG